MGKSYQSCVSKLNRQILFSLVQELHKDICHKCNTKIEDIKDFSIEHIIPWQVNKSAELFWDIKNISFSHLKCNIPSVYRGRNSHRDIAQW